MMWGAVRGFFYLWFSIAAGLAGAYAILFALSRVPGPSYTLPAGGWPLLVAPPALILASLVLEHVDHFGRRVSLRKWIPLCLVATLALVATALSTV